MGRFCEAHNGAGNVAAKSKSSETKSSSWTISSIGRVHKFHFNAIPNGWFKVDVQEAFMPNVALIFPNDDVDQNKIGEIVNKNEIWNQKYVKARGN